MDVQIIGCGDAFASGGRLNTCFLIGSAGRRFLIDCGTTSLAGLKGQGIAPNTIDTILITHLHGDHFGGLPFFLIDALYSSNRQERLTIAGPPGLRARLEVAMETLFPGTFAKTNALDLSLVEMLPGTELRLNELDVTVREVDHSSGAPSLGLRVGVGAKSVAYSGDTAWCPALVQLADGVDLFLIDCSGLSRPIPGHMNYDTIRRKASELTARRIVLTHMGPDVLSRLDELAFETAEDGKIFTV